MRQLLTHTSGIHDYAQDLKYYPAAPGDKRHRWTCLEQAQFALKSGKPHFAPGQGFHYSDTGYILPGEIIERVSKMSLAKAFRALLDFKKLKLDETYMESLEPAPKGVKALSHPYLGTLDTADFDPSFDLYEGSWKPPKI